MNIANDIAMVDIMIKIADAGDTLRIDMSVLSTSSSMDICEFLNNIHKNSCDHNSMIII